MVSIKTDTCQPRLYRGIALLEVLIALVVVAMGMLAVQGQLSSFAHTAHYMKNP